MKNIRWSTPFTRHYKQRISRDEQLNDAFWASVEAFVIDPRWVNDHPLDNVMQGQRSFSINDEYRVVYVEKADEYLFMDVGTHEQVYRRS